MKQNCYIVRDLMSSYIEGLTSEETTKEVAEHLAECSECAQTLERMTAEVKVVEEGEQEKASNVGKVSYLKKCKRALIIAMSVIGVLCTLIVGTVVLGLSVLMHETTETYTDPAQYASILGENGKYKNNLMGKNNIFPDKLPQGTTVEEFSYTYLNRWDDYYVGYLVCTLDPDSFRTERRRLASLPSKKVYDEYGAVGFNYELCAVYSNEYGIIYALADKADNRLIYVSMEFCNFICDIDYRSIIDSKYLPIGFDATEGNSTRAAFDRMHAVPKA